jgi:AcrR family transcriptional regulator
VAEPVPEIEVDDHVAASPARPGLPSRLIEATIDLLASDGLTGLSLREIARRAGVSHGAPLYHFPSLSALLTEVAAEGFRRLFSSVDKAVRHVGVAASPRARVVAATHAYVEFALAHPGLYQLMFMDELLETHSPKFIQAALVQGRQGAALIREYQQSGWHTELDPDRLVLAYWAAVHGTIVLWSQRVMHDLTGDATIDNMLEAVMSITLGKEKVYGRRSVRQSRSETGRSRR